MMPADLNLHVWLDTEPDTTPAVIIPYVESDRSHQLQYRVSTVKKGTSGTSRISQGGTVTVKAGQATALTRFSLSLGANDECHIDLVLIANGIQAGSWEFECPDGMRR